MTLNILYNVILHGVAAPVLALYYLPKVIFGKKYRESLRGKLGRFDQSMRDCELPQPRVWFHAVSVGEVVALTPLAEAMKELMPDAGFVVSTGTETGQAKAKDAISWANLVLYMPLDFPASLNPVLDLIRPDLFVLMETELWPNLISGLKRRGAVIALANGRISDRSYPGYRRLRRFFGPLLENIDLMLMSSELDAERIRRMGAPAARVRVTGNTKFDAALKDTPTEAEERIRRVLGIERGAAALVAGSTHPGENEIILAAYQRLSERFPGLILVIVPRHVEKTAQVLSLMTERGMEPPFLRSSADAGETRDGRRVIIVDRTGELFQVYSVASVTFIGGSLVPKGGQNIVEPAAWGKVVLFGPSMEDFREARDILERSGAGVEVRSVEDVVRRAAEFLSNDALRQRCGEAGKQALLQHRGSARRCAELLTELV
jgi:3-deoxy-D-manno-octulosonic-acid transferase